LSGDRAPFDQGQARWAAGLDPMIVEAAAWEAYPVVPRGELQLSLSGKASAPSALIVEQDALDVDRIQIPDVELSVPLAGSSDPVQDACVLSSDGLLSSSEGGGSEMSPWSPSSCSVDMTYSPRSVMDLFQVSLSPVSKMGPLGTVARQQSGALQGGRRILLASEGPAGALSRPSFPGQPLAGAGPGRSTRVL
jgi:hypothetical protein